MSSGRLFTNNGQTDSEDNRRSSKQAYCTVINKADEQSTMRNQVRRWFRKLGLVADSCNESRKICLNQNGFRQVSQINYTSSLELFSATVVKKNCAVALEVTGSASSTAAAVVRFDPFRPLMCQKPTCWLSFFFCGLVLLSSPLRSLLCRTSRV